MGKKRQRTGYWVLFADPKIYRIEESVHERAEENWRTHGKDIQLGDRVVIWKGKGRDKERGVITFGEVVKGPCTLTDKESDPYKIDPARFPSGDAEYVRVRYALPSSLPLWYGDKPTSVVNRLGVSRAHGSTVFYLESEEWDALIREAGMAERESEIGDRP